MKTITYQQLKERNACSGQLKLFRQRFGGQVIITADNTEELIAQAAGFDIRWLAGHFLSELSLTVYDVAAAAAQAEHNAATTRAQAVYDSAVATTRAQAEYNAATAAARADYRAATTRAQAVYDSAVATTRALVEYNAATAAARADYRAATTRAQAGYDMAAVPALAEYKAATARAFIRLFLAESEE